MFIRDSHMDNCDVKSTIPYGVCNHWTGLDWTGLLNRHLSSKTQFSGLIRKAGPLLLKVSMALVQMC